MKNSDMDSPAKYWLHIRIGNPIERPLATIRRHTARTKSRFSCETAKIMMFKVIQAVQKSWQEPDDQNQFPKVIEGINIADGIETVHHRAIV